MFEFRCGLPHGPCGAGPAGPESGSLPIGHRTDDEHDKAGTRLNQFYGNNRITDGDGFFVKVK
ncbi:hypothetical protein OHA04_45070 (plasmid) [Streptomyces sp. NBC_01590]|uniref:hypothetical protein n=1 Tax=Streptomyces sp. NBC_01590 TaxID=2975887 RepID=UPI002F911974